jgi:DNA-binding protein HU-beta
MKKKDVVAVFEELAALSYKEAKNSFTIPGRNPKTGEQIQIPAKTVVKFRIAKAAKDAILQKK